MSFNGMSLESLNVTPEEFKEYFGIDLEERLALGFGGGNPSNEQYAYIKRQRVRLNTFIDYYFGVSGGKIGDCYGEPTDYQKFHYKMALLEQIYYTLTNGEISTRSGIDENMDATISQGELEGRSICIEAKRHLVLCGLYNRTIYSHGFRANWWWSL